MSKFLRYISLTIILNCFLIVGCFNSTAWGQTIHVILAADVSCNSIGRGVEVDLEQMTRLFQSNIPPANLNLVTIPSESMAPSGMLAAVNNLNVDSNDTIVFYYSGHGSFDVGTQRQFFNLTRGGNLYRETLLTAIKEKAPRLTVLLTDCCNNNVTVAGTRSAERLVFHSGRTPNSFSPLFENLFLFCTGVVDITSSKPGEYSFATQRGSTFTTPLVELLDSYKTNEEMHWNEVVAKLAPRVQEAFLAVFPRDRFPRGFVGPGVDGQTSQSVYVHSLPGMRGVELDALANNIINTPAPVPVPAPAPNPVPTPDPPRVGPRLGLRAIDHDGNGVRITEIVSSAPATRAGFIVGEIITEINGRAIRNEADYSNAIDNSPRMMEVRLRRADNSTRTLTVELGW